MPQQEVRHRLRIRRDVERLVGANTRLWARRHVTDRIAAGLASRDADFGQPPHQVGRIVDVDVVILEVLAGGDVGHAHGVLFTQVGQLDHLGGVDDPHGDLDALHLNTVLPLAVYPVPQTKLQEDLLRHLARLDPPQLGFEDVDLFLGGRRKVGPAVVAGGIGRGCRGSHGCTSPGDRAISTMLVGMGDCYLYYLDRNRPFCQLRQPPTIGRGTQAYGSAGRALIHP